MSDSDTLECLVRPLKCGSQILDIARHQPPEWKTATAKIVGLLRAELSTGKKTPTPQPALSCSAGETVCTIPAQSFVSPRGRFVLQFCEDCMVLKKANGGAVQTVAAYKDIGHVFKLPKQDRYKTKKGHVWVFHLSSPAAQAKGKPLQYIMFETVVKGKALRTGFPEITVEKFLKKMDKQTPVTHKGTLPGILDEMIHTCILSRKARPPRLISPDSSIFCGSTQNMAISCYYKVNDGLLYPLKAGLLFIQRPILFVPAANIDELSFGRGGSNSTKTLDLALVTESQGTIEFRMIEREEQQSLRQYSAVLMKLRKAAAKRALKKEGHSDSSGGVKVEGMKLESEKRTPTDEEDASDDSDDDSDFEVDGGDDSGGSGSSSSDDDGNGSNDDDDNTSAVRAMKRSSNNGTCTVAKKPRMVAADEEDTDTDTAGEQ